MKNILALGVVAALGLSSAAMAGVQIVDTSAAGGAIPDASLVGVTATLEGTGGTIQSFDWASINGLTHTWSGDVAASLEHGGTTVWLLNRPGLEGANSPQLGCCGNGGDFLGGDYYFQDGGIPQVLGPGEDWVLDGLANAYDPSGNLGGVDGDLSAFNGMDASGTWTMTVYDGAGGDTGAFDSFSIAYTIPAPGALALLGLAGLTSRRRRR